MEPSRPSLCGSSSKIFYLPCKLVSFGKFLLVRFPKILFGKISLISCIFHAFFLLTLILLASGSAIYFFKNQLFTYQSHFLSVTHIHYLLTSLMPSFCFPSVYHPFILFLSVWVIYLIHLVLILSFKDWASKDMNFLYPLPSPPPGTAGPLLWVLHTPSRSLPLLWCIC